MDKRDILIFEYCISILYNYLKNIFLNSLYMSNYKIISLQILY